MHLRGIDRSPGVARVAITTATATTVAPASAQLQRCRREVGAAVLTARRSYIAGERHRRRVVLALVRLGILLNV